MKAIDETGEKYYLLKVDNRSEKSHRGKAWWDCTCDCGKKITVLGYNLRKGFTRSCGCLSSRDWTNEIVNWLTVIKFDHINKHGLKMWLCICKCGKETIISSLALHNKQKSCGCITKLKGEEHPNWKGGESVCSYDTYNSQVSFVDKTRRNPDNHDQLQVRCKKCDNWMNPTWDQVNNRKRALNNKVGGESHFYCSQKCKDGCPIFNKEKWPEGEAPKNSYDRGPYQKQWADMVKEKDGWKCLKCGSIENLEAHHKYGLNVDPMIFWDIYNGLTYCIKCHNKAHQQPGCTFHDLRKDPECKS